MMNKIQQAFPSLSEKRRWWKKGYRLPPRYGLIILGGGLLMFAGDNRVLVATSGVVKPQEILVIFASFAGMISLIVAAAPVPARALWRRCYRLLIYPLYVAALFLILGTLVTFAGTLNLVLQQPAAHAYVNDVISFTQVNAELALSRPESVHKRHGLQDSPERVSRCPADSYTPRGIRHRLRST